MSRRSDPTTDAHWFTRNLLPDRLPDVIPDGWFRLGGVAALTFTRVHEGVGVGIVQELEDVGGARWWAYSPHVEPQQPMWRQFDDLEVAKAWCWERHLLWMAADAEERLR